MVDVAIKTKKIYFVLWMFIFELNMYFIFLKMKYIILHTQTVKTRNIVLSILLVPCYYQLHEGLAHLVNNDQYWALLSLLLTSMLIVDIATHNVIMWLLELYHI